MPDGQDVLRRCAVESGPEFCEGKPILAPLKCKTPLFLHSCALNHNMYITFFTLFTCVCMSLEGVVKITVGGRITLPKDIRKELGWRSGLKLKVLLEGRRVILELTEAAE